MTDVIALPPPYSTTAVAKALPSALSQGSRRHRRTPARGSQDDSREIRRSSGSCTCSRHTQTRTRTLPHDTITHTLSHTHTHTHVHAHTHHHTHTHVPPHVASCPSKPSPHTRYSHPYDCGPPLPNRPFHRRLSFGLQRCAAERTTSAASSAPRNVMVDAHTKDTKEV